MGLRHFTEVAAQPALASVPEICDDASVSSESSAPFHLQLECKREYVVKVQF